MGTEVSLNGDSCYTSQTSAKQSLAAVTHFLIHCLTLNKKNKKNNIMKIYILLDEYLNSEHHCDFVDVFDSAEAVLKYISENQSDGHKFKYETREFQDPSTGINIDYQNVTPIKTPITPGETYPLGITWGNYPPCFNGGPCTNPHHDCINCPRPYGGVGTYSTNTIDEVKPKNTVTTSIKTE